MPEVGRGVVIPSATSQTLDIAIAAPSPSVLLADVTLDMLPGLAKRVSRAREEGHRPRRHAVWAASQLSWARIP